MKRAQGNADMNTLLSSSILQDFGAQEHVGDQQKCENNTLRNRVSHSFTVVKTFCFAFYFVVLKCLDIFAEVL